jgi:hypothetical protein
MVESICGQSFAYTREVEEETGKIPSQTRARGYRQKATENIEAGGWNEPFYSVWYPAFK